MRVAIPSFISLDKNSALEKTMRQTAVKAVPFAKSGAKPQRESDETKNIEKRWGKIPEGFQARSRVYYHRQVRTPIAKAMFGEYQE